MNQAPLAGGIGGTAAAGPPTRRRGTDGQGLARAAMVPMAVAAATAATAEMAAIGG